MKEDRPTALGWVADAINRAHAETKGVTIVLENMAGQGDVLGSRAEDLRDIIALVKDQSRVGVCVDTCESPLTSVLCSAWLEVDAPSPVLTSDCRPSPLVCGHQLALSAICAARDPVRVLFDCSSSVPARASCQ